MSGRAVSSIRSIEMEFRARVTLSLISVRWFRGGEVGREKGEAGSEKREAERGEGVRG